MRQRNLPAGVYMQLASPAALVAWLTHRDMSYADLAELVGCSKQFIHMLATGKKTTCSPLLAARIEKVLLPAPALRGPGDLPLFVERGSKPLGGRRPRQRKTLTDDEREQRAQRRFLRMVDRGLPEECWPWKGHVLAAGYGQFRVDTARREVAHRYSYEMFVGPVPEGAELGHAAGCTRDCVNPAHLVMRSDSMSDVGTSETVGGRSNTAA